MLLLIPLLGCGAPDDAAVDTDPTGAAPNTWNVLVYMAGDNNLEDLLHFDLNDLEAGGSDDRVHVYALVDRSPDYDTGWGDWTGTRLYRIAPDTDMENVASPFDDRGELDMGDPVTLAGFGSVSATRFAVVFTKTKSSMSDSG